MSNINTGGPAFPQNTKIVAAAGQELHQGFMGGISIRDYFAAKAMEAWIESTTKTYNHNGESHVDIVNVEQIARNAYAQADAMLKARDA